MKRSHTLGPMIQPAAAGTVKSPKTAELVAGTLRRMIVDGQLTDGDFIPNETELMAHFGVSRPSLREAVRILESERLVEVRRGSRTGARVRVPGPEILARPAGLLLELSGATLADVMATRIAIEPTAAKLLAEEGTKSAHAELERLVDGIPSAWEAGELANASAYLHRRMVELAGNTTLALIAGMLHEIAARHTTVALSHAGITVAESEYAKLLRSYQRLISLLRAREGERAYAHWRRHMESAGAALLKGYEKTKVRDIMN